MKMDLDLMVKMTGCKPDKAAIYAEPLTEAMQVYAIDKTALRMAAFIAQVAHESGLFTIGEENLRYSSEGLLTTFRKYFRPDEVDSFEKQPEKIANRVYADRNGNGSEASGEGWRYRGRGLIQLTGKENYRACGQDLEIDLVSNPEAVLNPVLSAMVACWFWNSKDLNPLADAREFEKITKRINGGLNGYEDRKKLYAKAKAALGVA